ncbi:MAG: YebC/PmpR family DNA-binding transcriptional regulator, partial [Dehalococcoidia bacterium]
RLGGNLGEAGCVAWNCEPKGVVRLTVEPQQAEDVALLAIDAGAEDVQVDGGDVEIYTTSENLEGVRQELAGKDIAITSAELSMVPKTTVSLGDKEAAQTLRLLDALEELADVQKVYSNADFPEAVLEQYQREG